MKQLEEKLKAKSTEAMVYGKIVKSDTSITMQKQIVIKLTDAIAICQQEIAGACKKAKIEECEYWREIIFSPEQQAIKPTISLTDFQLRIVELSPKESE